MARARVIIIGAGINGLAAACTLAKAGLAPVVLERAEHPGGCLKTEPWEGGARVPSLTHVCGPVLPELVERAGLAGAWQAVGADGHTCALSHSGDALLIEHDDRVVDLVRGMATPDSRRVVEFSGTVKRLAGILRPFLLAPPPAVGELGLSDVLRAFTAGRRIRALDRRDAHRLLQWAPMPVADLVDEWFEAELLKATVSARAIFGRAAGPVSAWTTLEILVQAALTGRVIATSATVRGGPGAVADALATAAVARGAQLRLGSSVARIDVAHGKVTGVTLETGERLEADVVVSTLTPQTTFLSLLDSVWLGPEFVSHVRNIRSNGVVAKVNLLVSALPDFDALRRASPDLRDRALAGHIHLGPSREVLEHAHDATKYGELAAPPWLNVAVPTAADDSLAPVGLHVMSVYVQGVPTDPRGSDWDRERDRLGHLVVETLASYAPTLPRHIVDRQVITPSDLARHHGLTGGHIFHGEHAVDQLFLCRPVYGWARYRTPVDGLYFGGAGAHPGGGVTGACGFVCANEVLASSVNRSA